VSATFPLVLAIATTIFCFAAPFGVPAIVFAVRARAAGSAGSADVARARARISLAFSGAGIVLGLLIELFLLIRHMAAGFQ